MSSWRGREDGFEPEWTPPGGLPPRGGKLQPTIRTGAERSREPWGEETRETYRSWLGPTLTPANLYDVRTFYRQLEEEVQRAQRRQLPLEVIAFHTAAHAHEARHRAAEWGLRLGIRREDFAARLTDTTLAVAISGTRVAALALVQRIVPALSRAGEGPVGVGIALHPDDGRTAYALLQAAAWRSVGSGAPRSQDPELEYLLGPPPV